MERTEIAKLETEKVRWDLNFIYSGISDPQIDADVKKFSEMAKSFHNKYDGNLLSTLGEAITCYSEIKMLSNKIELYLHCLWTANLTDPAIKTKKAEVEKIFTEIYGNFLEFFTLQIVELPETELLKICEKDPVVSKHQPWLKQIRVFKPHVLSEEIESALTKRSSFSSGAWGEFYNEVEAELAFKYKNGKRTLTEMLHIMTNSKDAKERFKVMEMINEKLDGFFLKYSAQTLFMISGEGAIERQERKYRHPMESRNKQNLIPDTVVDALHRSILDVAGPLAKRYYKLKARHLGLKTLRWSDRNAPMPFADTSIISFDEAIKTVIAAYENFSPSLAKIVRKILKEKRIDAPVAKNKRSGAFCHYSVLPNHMPAAFVLLNFLGSSGDVMTLAHELGHAVHGILAGETQGILMQTAPMVYAETASIFGETTVFNFLKKRLKEKKDKTSLLALLMEKIDDVLNTTVRQIGFSNFERRLHGMDKNFKAWNEPKKLSPEELNTIWLETIKPLYGEEGEIFTYKHMEHFWAYIPHFHWPFYVYSYAFGELFTQSLYAVKNNFGKEFEAKYLDLLKAGGTKDAIELLKPFGLNPSREEFWTDGINTSLGAFIKEAEELTQELALA